MLAGKGNGAPGGGNARKDDDIIRDGDIRSFATDVLEASRTVPVIVDFWAPWCGPCRTLGPVLEKVVREARGKARLVKINIDDPANQSLAMQLQIRSVPAVFIFDRGQPVDGFTGAVPESRIRAMLERFTGGSGGEELLAAVRERLEQRDAAGAIRLLDALPGEERQEPAAVALLGRALVMEGRLGEARTLLEKAADPAGSPGGKVHGDISSALRALELAEQGAEQADRLSALRCRLEEAPEDHQARFDLAIALYATDHHEEACDQLLGIIRRDRSWNEDMARRKLLEILEAVGISSPLALAVRRRLSAAIFR